jgi:probable rRNA maturation factor
MSKQPLPKPVVPSASKPKATRSAAFLAARSPREATSKAVRVALPELSLSLQFADPRHRVVLPRHKVVRWIRAGLELPAEITVRIVDAEEGQTLNRDFRAKDYATNVLTFDYTQEPVITADLVLCAPVVEAEATAEGKTLEAHYAHLLVHGTLHAQGFDHAEEDEALAMEAREREVLARLGFDDPYR